MIAYFKDNNGQERVEIEGENPVFKNYDYKPFGDLCNPSAATTLNEELK
jgi:hypothetical protein